MSVEEREITCYEYINSLNDIVEYSGKGLYGLDNIRTELHDLLCKQFKINKAVTKKYTDNIKLDSEKCAEDLYLSLLEESRMRLK